MNAVTFRAEDTGAKPVSDQNTVGIIREMEYRHGRIRYLSTDYGVGRMLELHGDYFEGELAVMRRLIRPGDVVVSAGGNIGVHLIPLSRMAGSVVTFEPQAFLREKLLQPNLDMNNCTNVTVRPEALGEVVGSASLPTIDYCMPNNFGGMELRAQGPCPVPVIPLDSLDLASCALIMLDVEGFELPALKGARETIKRCRPYLYVEIDRDDTRESVLAYMVEELGYEVLFHTPPAFRADNFAGQTRNHFGIIRSVMCLGIPS